MKILKIDQALELCKSHLDNTGCRNTEIEIYIARYLQVMICASYEGKIKEIIAEKMSRTRKSYIQSFANSYMKNLLRSIKTGDLGEILNKFGSKYREKFIAKINQTVETQRAQTYFNNIVTERHITAHDAGSSMTFDELVRMYNDSHIIIDFFKEVLLGRTA